MEPSQSTTSQRKRPKLSNNHQVSPPVPTQPELSHVHLPQLGPTYEWLNQGKRYQRISSFDVFSGSIRLRPSLPIAEQSSSVRPIQNELIVNPPQTEQLRKSAKIQIDFDEVYNAPPNGGPVQARPNQPVPIPEVLKFGPIERNRVRQVLFYPIRWQKVEYNRVYEPTNFPSLFELAVIACGRKFTTLSINDRLNLTAQLPAIAFNALHAHFKCHMMTMLLFSYHSTFSSQIVQLCREKHSLTIILRKPSAQGVFRYNDGHIFLMEDLKKFHRNNETTREECITLLYHNITRFCFLHNLFSLFSQIDMLTIILEGSLNPFDPEELKQLFARLLCLPRILKFSFVRSTRIHQVDDKIERRAVSALYRLFEEHLTAEKMPRLRQLNIWITNFYRTDKTFMEANHRKLCLNLKSIMPQLEGFTFVGPCANRYQLLREQLGRATRLTSLTLDVTRAFGRLPPTNAQIRDIRQYFTDRIPASLFNTVTKLRLYRTDFKDNNNMSVLIRLFPQLHTLQVHHILRDGHRAFNVAGLHKLTELRLDNFDLNGFNFKTKPFIPHQYPSVTKLTFCKANLFRADYSEHVEEWNATTETILPFRFPQYPNVREIQFFTQCNELQQARATRYMNRYFEVYGNTLRKCEVCFNAVEIGHPSWRDEAGVEAKVRLA